MAKKKKLSGKFDDLTWDDLNQWAGARIVGRGRSYQRQGRVADLVKTEDDALMAWVAGTEPYVTRVEMGDKGLSECVCTCPCEFACKHGVAVVLEYLERVENDQPVPRASEEDERFELLARELSGDAGAEEEVSFENIEKEIGLFLKGKTRAQLVKLIRELAEQYPEIAKKLVDRRQLTSGDTNGFVKQLRREIREMGREPGWQNYWGDEGYTPDYSGIRSKLDALLEAGHADEVLGLGEELVAVGMRQVEESDDEGETAIEIAGCMPVIVKALKLSSLESADKLAWAVDLVLKDDFDLCDAFVEYLYRRHPKAAWSALADQLLAKLKGLKRAPKEIDNFSWGYTRDSLSNWAIHALERAGRKEEIIPLCEVEARKTYSYERLVANLVETRRYEEAEQWILEGIRATDKKWFGVAANLREKLRDIRIRQKDWPAVAAMEVEAFVRAPSQPTFTECEKSAGKVKAWPKVRQCLLAYLEKGTLPWEQKGWPLPASGLDRPEVDRRQTYPMVEDLIRISIYEKKPDEVLRWYDRRPKERFGWYGVDEGQIAEAIQAHAPDRAVAMWKRKAEGLIAQVKPSAYQDAARYLRKAADVMAREKKQVDWERYLKGLREEHARKRRLIEILDGMEGKPIVKKRR